jgi:poly-gamma-glutamate capsule biosynthesis protein CapA/YwtB (metallophosphatase superfamily)
MRKKMSFSASGDSLMVRRLPKGYDGLWPVSEFIKSADARLTNLEAVISDYDCFPSTYSGGTWVNATPDVLPDLLSFGFNMFGCANNHSMDYSYGGLLSTIKALKGVPFAGIGRNLEEAIKPAVLETPSGRVGMLSVTSTFNDAARAGTKTGVLPARPGLNAIRSHTVYTVTPEHMKALKEIAKGTKINGENDNSKKEGFSAPDPEGCFSFGGIMFREGSTDGKMTYCNKADLERTRKIISEALNYVDYLVVMAHSHQIKGSVYHEPDYFFEEFCRACIDAGAAAVIGGGTHQLKPVEVYKGKPIFYSLGNFIFQNNFVKYLPPDFMEKYGLPPDCTAEEALNARCKNGTIGLQTDPANYRSIIPYFEVEGESVKKLILKPIELGFDKPGILKGLPYEADVETANGICEHLKNISRDYGTIMRFTGGCIEVETA